MEFSTDKLNKCSINIQVPSAEELNKYNIDVQVPFSDRGLPGKSAYELAVENGFTGTESDWLASLKGSQGPQGEQGIQGERGEKGEPGAGGVDGKSATITIGTVTTLDAGSSATVENVGTSTDAIFNFGIPKGADGIVEETDPVFSASASASITSQDITNWNNKSDFDGSYNSLTDKPIIPTKTSELTNDSGFLTSIPNEYITESELSSKGFLTSVPSEYVTETELNNKGYLTEHQDLSGKQDKLVSGTNIKTINNQSLLGEGNIAIDGGSGLPSGGTLGQLLRKNSATDGDASWSNDTFIPLEPTTIESYGNKYDLLLVPEGQYYMTEDGWAYWGTQALTSQDVYWTKGTLLFIKTFQQDVYMENDGTYIPCNCSHIFVVNKYDYHSNFSLGDAVMYNIFGFKQISGDKVGVILYKMATITDDGGTGNVSKVLSDTVNFIMVVDKLPEIEEEGVLYLVKEVSTPVVSNLYPSQVEHTETNGFTVTFKERNVIANGSNDTASVWGWTTHFNMNLEANKTYYLQFTNVSGSFDDSKRISQSDGIVNAVTFVGYDSSGTSTNLINSVERTASGIYEKYTFTPTTTYAEYSLSMQVKRLNVFTNWTCSIVIAEESV